MVRRSPNVGVEVLWWNDPNEPKRPEYSTVNVTNNGLSQQTFGPYDGHLSLGQALLQIGTMIRLEGEP